MEPFSFFPSPQFLAELDYWRRYDPKIAARIGKLIDDIARDPFRGIGKPEHLKHLRPNLWSRRINDEHRLVYLVGVRTRPADSRSGIFERQTNNNR